MVLVGYNKQQHVFLTNFKYMTILLKRGVLVALKFIMHISSKPLESMYFQ